MMKPSRKSMATVMRGRPAHSVAIQQKICTPVGTAIVMLAAVNKLWPSSGIGVANMWWTHRPNAKNAVAMFDITIAVYPNTGRRLFVSLISVIFPLVGWLLLL